jgi:hypothetical protein
MARNSVLSADFGGLSVGNPDAAQEQVPPRHSFGDLRQECLCHPHYLEQLAEIQELIYRIDYAKEAKRRGIDVESGTLAIVRDKLMEIYFNLGGDNHWNE